MKPLATTVVVAIALFGLVAARPVTPGHATTERAPDGHAFDGGARSAHELVEHFLEAVHAKDRDALRHLRVSEREYREIVVPGSVKPGEPPRQFTPEWVEFLWGSYETKNHYHEQDLLAAYGGKTLTLRKMSFAGGEHDYATYKAHRRLVLGLTDDEGKDLTLEMGSIAEAGGQYKFLALGRD